MTLVGLGFTKFTIDGYPFVRVNSHSITYMLTYVNDIILTGNNDDEVQSLVTTLNFKFALKYLGLLKYFFEIEVVKFPSDDMMMNRGKYREVLKTHMEYSKTNSTPITTSHALFTHIDELFDNLTCYRSVVDVLQYMTITRHDLTYAINKV